MSSNVLTEQLRRHSRRWTNATVIVSLLAGVLWLMSEADSAAGGAMRPSTSEHGQHADASSVARPHDYSNVHGHKEGKVAVVISVLGVIVVVVLIVFLGSLSARRRMPYRPWTKGRGDRGPPEPRRGLFE
jgi:hypothetical protein